MTWEHRPEFIQLTGLVREVKPSLSDVTIGANDLLIETLGLDSLDVTQLTRAVRRKMNRDFDRDTWLEGVREHKLSISSLLDAVTSPAVDAPVAGAL